MPTKLRHQRPEPILGGLDKSSISVTSCWEATESRPVATPARGDTHDGADKKPARTQETVLYFKLKLEC